MDTDKTQPIEDPIRPHSFDGIQEYDKALPNWWLFTFYITFVFSIGYWIYYHKTDMGVDQIGEYEANLARVEAAAAEFNKGAAEVNDESLLALSQDPEAVAAGQQHYMSNCFPCHGAELQGPPAPGLPGVSLVDAEWLHGHQPTRILATITDGVLEKGMPAWGPVLGPKRANELTAFILSKQDPNITPTGPSETPAANAAAPATNAATAVPPATAPVASQSNITNDELVALSQDPAVVAAGQTRYQTLCVACHGVNLEGPPAPGLPGVSLVDAEWLHGNEPLQIRGTIVNGIIEKGMVPWLAVVGEDGANELTAFILSKQP